MTGTEPTEADLVPVKDQLDLAATEVDAAVAHQAERAASIEARAGILTGAAAVVGSVQVTTVSTGWVPVLLLFSFAAAMLGLFVSKPRWDAVLDPSPMSAGILAKAGPNLAKHEILTAKIAVYEQRNPGIRKRAVVVLVGYAFLAASVGASLIVALIPIVPPK